MEDIEIWKPVKGYEGLYEVSSMGRVRSLGGMIIRKNGYHKTFQGRILKPWLNRGYEQVYLCNDFGRKHRLVHILVCSAFKPNPDNKPFVDHIDGNRRNNRIDNLRWCTAKENQNFELAKAHMSEAQRGEKHHMYGKFGADNPSSMPVSQYTKDGVFVRSFPAIMEAHRQTGISFSNIASVCRGTRKFAGGYIWKFIK